MDLLVAKLLVLIAAVAVLSGAAAKPAGKMDLTAVLNSTTCPIVVEFDDDEARIPKRIKTLKCGSDPQAHCRANNVPEHECCHKDRADVHMACVEVRDLVQVYFPESGKTQTYPISVGCTCVMQPIAQVQENSP